MFEVVLSPAASSFFESAVRLLALGLARCFRRLETDPRQGINIAMAVYALREAKKDGLEAGMDN